MALFRSGVANLLRARAKIFRNILQRAFFAPDGEISQSVHILLCPTVDKNNIL
jgi:hypothetical protein